MFIAVIDELTYFTFCIFLTYLIFYRFAVSLYVFMFFYLIDHQTLNNSSLFGKWKHDCLVLVWNIYNEIENYFGFCVEFWSLKMAWSRNVRNFQLMWYSKVYSYKDFCVPITAPLLLFAFSYLLMIYLQLDLGRITSTLF